MRQIFNLLTASPLIPSFLTFLVAAVLMLVVGGPMIHWLRNKRWRKQGESWMVREDTPDTHQAKQGTPSMGGIGINAATVIAFSSVVFTYVVSEKFTYPSGASANYPVEIFLLGLLLPITFLAHGFLGFADDWSKATGRGGLRARAKVIAQFLLAVGFLAYCLIYQAFLPTAFLGSSDPLLILPPVENLASFALSVGVLIIFLIGTCNAANLTDGIDGLASGLTVICGWALALSLPASISIHGFGVGSALFVTALAGACFGFLRFNKYKAQVFMGDTGSLAIGAGLAAASILLHAVWLMPFVGFIFYVEAASVTVQVLWFKWTKKRTGEGKRLLRRAPLHHHFELAGWSEWRVVLTFWGINLCTSAIGLFLWHSGILPRWP